MNKPEGTKKWKGVCAYDGTDFEGWQSQPRKNTIQDILEDKLATIFKKPVKIQGSARTDSGVHARQQVFHFVAAWHHPQDALFRAIMTGLPEGIQLISLAPTRKNFHALNSAKGKRYSYSIHEGQANPFNSRYMWSIGWRTLDESKMQEAANHLIGTHDFTAFTASGGSHGDNPVKELRKIAVKRKGNVIRITIEGSGFLYRMVRRISGMLYNVGLGRLDPGKVPGLLENKKRELVIHTAPAKGLCLEKVFY